MGHLNAGSPDLFFPRSLQTYIRLGLPERHLSEPLQHCTLGMPGLPESPQQQHGIAGVEVSLGIGLQYNIFWGLPGETCLLELPHHRRSYGSAGRSLLSGSLSINTVF